MTRLTHLASKDAATIRVFANVTLVLLPIIVVSVSCNTFHLLLGRPRHAPLLEG